MAAMKPLTKIAETTGPDGAAWELWERDGVFSLLRDGVAYSTGMSHGSEEAMAEWGAAPVVRANQPCFLFAGLGLGYGLAAAMRAMPREKARFIVAEPCGPIVEWNRTHARDLHPGMWDDPRVVVEPQSAVELARRRTGSLHAVFLTSTHARCELSPQDANDFFGALKGGGLLMIALARPDKRLEALLRRAGFEVTSQPAPASHKGKQTRMHTIVLARRGRFVPFAGRS